MGEITDISHVDREDNILVIDKDGSEIVINKFYSDYLEEEFVKIHNSWSSEVKNYVKESISYNCFEDLDPNDVDFPLEVEYVFHLEDTIGLHLMRDFGKLRKVDFLPFDRLQYGDINFTTTWHVHKDGSVELVGAEHNGKKL